MNRSLLLIVLGIFLAVTVFSCKQLEQATDDALVQTGNSDLKNMKDKGKKVVEAVEKLIKAFSEMSIQDERTLGETVTLQAYASGLGTPIRHRKLMMFSNVMANALAQGSDRPMIPYHVAVVDNKEFNAFAAPGGFIFVTTGLLEQLDNEAEMAVVIGHELGHIVKRHAVKDLQDGQALQAAMDLVNAAGSFADNLYSDANFDKFAGIVDEMTSSLVGSFNQYDTDIEFEADREGVQYALDLGYDPSAMLTVFDKLKAYYPQDSGTHPSLEERYKGVQEYINELKSKSPEDFEGLIKETGRMSQIKQWIAEGRQINW